MIWGVVPGRGKGLYVQTDSRIHPGFSYVGSGVLSLVVKELWHEVDESRPPSTEVKNEWCLISAAHMCVFMP